MTAGAGTGKSPNSVSMLGQRRIRLTGIETAIIISWTFRINTVMFTKYPANFLSKALKQTKAGPPSSGPPFLVNVIFCFPANGLDYLFIHFNDQKEHLNVMSPNTI